MDNPIFIIGFLGHGSVPPVSSERPLSLVGSAQIIGIARTVFASRYVTEMDDFREKVVEAEALTMHGDIMGILMGAVIGAIVGFILGVLVGAWLW